MRSCLWLVLWGILSSIPAVAEFNANRVTQWYLEQGDAAFRIAYEADARRVQKVYTHTPLTYPLSEQEMEDDFKRVQRLYAQADEYYRLAEEEHYRSTKTHEVANSVNAMKKDARSKLRALRSRQEHRIAEEQLRRTLLLAASLSSFSDSSYTSSSQSTSSSGSTGSSSGSKTWAFEGCYKDAFDCRVRFVNNYYCRSSWLGSAYECLSKEKTAPHACYCYR